MTPEAQQQNLIFTRIFDAPVEQVWQAWTEPELVMQWWGPDGFTAPIAEMDVREGSTAFLCMSSPYAGTHYSVWHYHKIVPMQRIEYVHKLADEAGNRIDPIAVGMPPDFPQDQPQLVTFKSLGKGRTEVTVIEFGWTVGTMMEMSRMGMNQCLDKMANLLSDSAA